MAKVYGDRWETTGSLAKGGQGEVFRVRDKRGEFSDELALKRVLNPKRHDRFRGEVEAIKRLDHPNVIRLIDHSALNDGEGKGEPEKQFLVMPLARAGDLSQRVELYKNNIDSVIQVAKQLASALRKAHAAGIIHRDVKPQNILFPEVGHVVWLSDFGICLVRDLDRATETSEVVGPARFMAPELEGGGRLDVNSAADVYSLGKVTYFMLSGGVILPRELLHEPEYAKLFEHDERQRLLGAVLAKMICPLASRLATMDAVLSEIERIENWTRDARLLPISPAAMAGFEQLQRRAIDKQRLADESLAARSRRDMALKTTTAGVLNWIEAELGKTSLLIGQGAGLSAGMRRVSDENTTPPVNHYIPGEAVELWVQSSHDLFHRQHVLRFSICTKFSMQFRVHVGSGPIPDGPPEPEHTDVAILPAYGQLYASPAQGKPSWNFLTMANGLYQPIPRPGIASPVRGRQFHHQAAQPPQVQLMTFSTEQWPNVADHLPQVFQQAVDTFVSTLQAQI